MKNKNDEVNIFVLTHKKFDFPKKEINDIYMPLLCNSENINEDWGYFKDSTGDNISNLNKYYAELTGQYWAWKNTDADIIGFCHYRRFFAKNFLLKDLLDEKEIKRDLENFDIILPQLQYSNKCLIDRVKEGEGNNYGAKSKEYEKLRKIIEKYCPDYLPSFDNIVYGKQAYFCNMFITRKEIANDYFEWLFFILNKLEKEIYFSEYESNNLRVLGFIGEVLLSIYVDKNNLKVKEKYLYYSQYDKLSYGVILTKRFPLLLDTISKVAKVIKKSK